MGEFFPLHWLIILLVVVLLFGGRKIPEVMRGLGEGIRSFKDGMRGTDHPAHLAKRPPLTRPPAHRQQRLAKKKSSANEILGAALRGSGNGGFRAAVCVSPP